MRSDTAIGAAVIKQARMRAALSQVQLAERSGKAKVQIGRWETGVVAPSLDTLLELLRACGFDLPQTLEGVSAGGRRAVGCAAAAVPRGQD